MPCNPPVTRRHRTTVSPRKRSSGPLPLTADSIARHTRNVSPAPEFPRFRDFRARTAYAGEENRFPSSFLLYHAFRDETNRKPRSNGEKHVGRRTFFKVVKFAVQVSVAQTDETDSFPRQDDMTCIFPGMDDMRKGISKNSTGWIFSVWAKRPMQEDLSVATGRQPPKTLPVGLCSDAKSRRKPFFRGARKEKTAPGTPPDAAKSSILSRLFNIRDRGPPHFGMRNSGIGICAPSYMFMYCAKSR